MLAWAGLTDDVPEVFGVIPERENLFHVDSPIVPDQPGVTELFGVLPVCGFKVGAESYGGVHDHSSFLLTVP